MLELYLDSNSACLVTRIQHVYGCICMSRIYKRRPGGALDPRTKTLNHVFFLGIRAPAAAASHLRRRCSISSIAAAERSLLCALR
jgi:hypothetical protein